MKPKWTPLLLGLALLAGCDEKEAKKETETRPVRAMTVAPRVISDERIAVGEIRPRHESDLSFRVSGELLAWHVDVGRFARKGQVLASLDDRDYRSRLRSASADVIGADAVLVEARTAEARQRELLATGATTRANFDTALRNLRSAEAKHDSARAAFDLARDQLADTDLIADFDGIVTAVGAEPGQVVNAGQMMVRFARPDEKDAVFTIAESEFRARPTTPPEVTVALLSDPGVTAEGVVREVSPVADPTTRTFQVKITLRSTPPAMRFGGSVVGRLKTATAPVVVLPASALFDRGNAPAVWLVDQTTHALSLREVAINRYEVDRVVVAGGLTEGDVVVTAGVNRLRERQHVRITEGNAPRLRRIGWGTSPIWPGATSPSSGSKVRILSPAPVAFCRQSQEISEVSFPNRVLRESRVTR